MNKTIELPATNAQKRCIHRLRRAIPGLDDEFRVIVSPWILTVLVTDRLARYYETVTKHNLKYRRYYHQFDY